MKISVVVLSWNRRIDLEATLNKLQKQTINDFEIIVVDNGSEDGSPEMVKEKFPQVVLIRLAENLGMGAWNIGAINAKGKHLVFLDDDSYPKEDALEKIVDKFGDDPKLGAIAGLVYDLNTGGVWDAFRWFGLDEKPRSKRVVSFIGSGVAFRKDLFLRINGYDINYFIYGIELPLSALIYHNGYYIYCFPEIIFYHKYSVTNRTNRRSYYYTTRNSLWTVWQFYPLVPSMLKTVELILFSLARAATSINLIPCFFTANFSALTKFHFYFIRNRVKLKRNVFEMFYHNLKPVTSYLRERRVRKRYRSL